MTDATFTGTVCTSPSGMLAQTQADHLARQKRLGVIQQVQDYSLQLARLKAEISGLQRVKELALVEIDSGREELARIQKRLNVAQKQNDFALQPIRLITKITADYFGVTFTDLTGKNRKPRFALPRHVAMYLAKIKTSHSFPQIGRQFGDRDHSTIVHGVQKIENRLLVDPKLRDDMTELLLRIAFVETQEKTNADANTPVPAKCELDVLQCEGPGRPSQNA